MDTVAPLPNMPRLENPDSDLQRSTSGQHLSQVLKNPEARTWDEATPVMNHFDSMDVTRCGRLYPEDFARDAANKLKNEKLQISQQKLREASRQAGLERRNSFSEKKALREARQRDLQAVQAAEKLSA